ncbi:hypothetical protein B0H13DRAFT_2656093 [Mycena leptocephala]|nr:hypothetical protein B0H13DRAFT_2656093 [Mycena leptocephala]
MLSFLGTALTVAILTGYALGRPISTDASQRFWRLDVGKTQCFTQRAAIASDCQLLLANPPLPDWTNVAPAGATPVFQPFCSGSCCVFTDTADLTTDELLSAGSTLMGCLEPANGIINGITKIESGSVCLADKTGAKSCFRSVQ